MNKNIRYIWIVLFLIATGIGIYLWISKSITHSEKEHHKEQFTCPMHPEIIRDQLENCPICGMDLVKIPTKTQAIEQESIASLLQPTDQFVVGNFDTTTAKDTVISTTINLPGIISYDLNAAVNIAARMSGRIERMYVNYKYQTVAKGQKLFDIYSPELLTEQQNFIYLIVNDAENKTIINASKQKLLLYGMTQSQINALITTKKSNPRISVFSAVKGIIQGTNTMSNPENTEMKATQTTESLTLKEGDYVNKGQTVFKILRTDKVWAIFNIAQGDNSLVKKGQSIKILTELDDQNSINAKINFVETQLNPVDKSNRVRVYLDNSTLRLPIGLRLQGMVYTNPISGIWINKQSIVSLGTKKIVFLKKKNGFQATAIKAGIQLENFIQILSGITTRDTIAQKAHYLIDSESFIKTNDDE